MSDLQLPNLTETLRQPSVVGQDEVVPLSQETESIPHQPTHSPRSNQLPTWMVIAFVVVVLAIPAGLLALTGGSTRNPSPDTESGLAPTRTQLNSDALKPSVTGVMVPTKQPMFPSATPEPELTPTSSPSATPTPTPASLSNLVVEAIALEDPRTGQKLNSPYYAGQQVSLRATVKNSGTAKANAITSYWKYRGALVGKNTAGSVAAGATAVYDDINSLVYSGVVLVEGETTLAYFLDPDNALGEANITDNSQSLTITVNPTRSDLEISEIELYTPQGEKITTPTAGQQVVVKPVVKNLGQDAQTNLDLVWYINGGEVKRATFKQWVVPGESLTASEGYSLTLAAGTTELKVEINKDKAVSETNSGNNTRIRALTL